MLDRIERKLEAGEAIHSAGYAEGLSKTTIQRWIKKGIRDQAGDRYTPHRRFAEMALRRKAKRLKAAEEAIDETLADIDGMRPDLKFKAAQWTLKTQLPEEYGETVKIQLQGEIESLLDRVRAHMSAEAYRELLNAIAIESGIDLHATEPDLAEDAGGDGGSPAEDPCRMH